MMLRVGMVVVVTVLMVVVVTVVVVVVNVVVVFTHVPQSTGQLVFKALPGSSQSAGVCFDAQFASSPTPLHTMVEVVAVVL